jgi:hypothetical protein
MSQALKGCIPLLLIFNWPEVSHMVTSKTAREAGRRWLMPIILATQETEIRRISC